MNISTISKWKSNMKRRLVVPVLILAMTACFGTYELFKPAGAIAASARSGEFFGDADSKPNCYSPERRSSSNYALGDEPTDEPASGKFRGHGGTAR